MATLQVLADEVLKESGLSGTRLTDYVLVRHAVGRVHAERLDAVAPVRAAQEEESVWSKHLIRVC